MSLQGINAHVHDQHDKQHWHTALGCQLNHDALTGLRPSLLFSPVIYYQVLAVCIQEKNQIRQPAEESMTALRPVQVLGEHTLALGEIRGVIILQKGNRIRESSYLSISFSPHSSGRWRDAGKETQSMTVFGSQISRVALLWSEGTLDPVDGSFSASTMWTGC